MISATDFPLTPTLSPVGRGRGPRRRASIPALTPRLPCPRKAFGVGGFPLPTGERVRVRGAMRQDDISTFQARLLRQTPGAAEQALWQVLRDRRFQDAKFRRQAPVGPFLAGFLCKAHRLIVEVSDEAPADARRDGWLTAQGYRILRLTRQDVLTDLPGCLARIAAGLAR